MSDLSDEQCPRCGKHRPNGCLCHIPVPRTYTEAEVREHVEAARNEGYFNGLKVDYGRGYQAAERALVERIREVRYDYVPTIRAELECVPSPADDCGCTFCRYDRDLRAALAGDSSALPTEPASDLEVRSDAPSVVGDRACKHGDPTCPCQDGDLCHYEADETTPAMAAPLAGDSSHSGTGGEAAALCHCGDGLCTCAYPEPPRCPECSSDEDDEDEMDYDDPTNWCSACGVTLGGCAEHRAPGLAAPGATRGEGESDE